MALVALLGLSLHAGCRPASGGAPEHGPSTAATGAHTARDSSREMPGTPRSGLRTIAYDALPPEARDTAARIFAGGPFPFDRDGIVFENREGLLPRRERGYYREYTVVTPGSDDRGARRIVSGREGELYYTDDHYGSFQEIVP
jgi:ribonuclease T1